MADSRLVTFRNAFISGLLLLAPLAVTWMVFRWLVESVGGTFRPIFSLVVPENLLDHRTWGMLWDILSTLIVIVLITLLGFISRLFLGKFLVSAAERLVRNIPGVSSVYNTVKQIVDTFSAENRNLFSKAVMVQFPRAGMYSVGFLTNKARGEPQARTEQEVWAVFVPTTPNPTTGFLVMLPRKDIIELDMSVGDAMKLVISGGSVVPPWPPSGSMPPVPVTLPAPGLPPPPTV